MSRSQRERREVVLREAAQRIRRRENGPAARRVATLRAATALRLAASTGHRGN